MWSHIADIVALAFWVILILFLVMISDVRCRSGALWYGWLTCLLFASGGLILDSCFTVQFLSQYI